MSGTPRPVQSSPPGARRRAPSRTVHAAGFVIGLGLLAWCVWLVLSDQERMNEVRRLANAPLTLAGLVALSVGIGLATGMAFWSVLLPVTRVPLLDGLAVNAVATLLNNLPFKLSIVTRAYLHRTRNGVPVTVIAAWMGAVSAMLLTSLIPPVAATFLLGRVDGLWVAVVVALTLVLAAAVVALGRLTRTDAFWAWLKRTGDRFPGTLGRLTRWPGLEQVRDGPRMLASARGMGMALTWRSVAMGLGVWRFWVASVAVGGVAGAMTLGQCVVADSTYYFIQAAAPTGALGAREGGTVAAVAAMAGKQLPVVVLTVSAAETTANLLCAAVALLYLRFTRPSEPRPSGSGTAVP